MKQDILTVTEACQFLSLSKPTIYRLMKSGEFPRPLQLSKNRVAWRKSDILNWLSKLPTAGGF